MHNTDQVFVLDAALWRTAGDVYDAMFTTLGAPEWHGRNLNALADSIVTGSINKIDLPYKLVFKNLEGASPEACNVVMFIKELEDETKNLVVEIETRK